jgi:hypothetical protein
VSDRFSARTTSGRRGLLWVALALVFLLLVSDLMRGPDSLVLGALGRLDPEPSREQRLFQRLFRR